MDIKNTLLPIIHNRFFWPLLLLLTCCLIYLNFFSLKIEDATLTSPIGIQEKISLPYFETLGLTSFTISGKIYFNKLLSVQKVHIKPDDNLAAVRINQKVIAFAGSVENDTSSSFHLDLGKYLTDGVNTIEFTINNTGNTPAGLAFGNSWRDLKALSACTLAILAALGILYLILINLKSHRAVILILLGGLLIRLCYLAVTPYMTRSHDIYGHIFYINHVLVNWTRPAPQLDWETYQPPLYYFAAAIVYKAGKLLGVYGNYQLYGLVQFFSMLLSMGFLLFAFATFRQLLFQLNILRQGTVIRAHPPAKPKSDRFMLLMLGLLTYWPSSIIHSVRIGNDDMLYFFYAGGLYFLCKWFFAHKTRDMYLSSIFITLSLFTKTNGLVLVGLFGIIYIWKFFQDKERKPKKYLIHSLLLLGIFASGFWLSLGEAVAEKLKGSTNNFLVPNIVVEKNEAGVNNGPVNYLGFDPVDYVTVPYADPSADKGGRQYFWTYLFKTSLLGEFHFDTPFHNLLALLLFYQFFGLALFTVGGLVFILHREWRNHLVLFLNLILLLIAALLFRISIPLSCSNDFRYILPIPISFCFFYGYAVLCFQQRGWKVLTLTGYVLAGLFVSTSCLFILRLQTG